LVVVLVINIEIICIENGLDCQKDTLWDNVDGYKEKSSWKLLILDELH